MWEGDGVCATDTQADARLTRRCVIGVHRSGGVGYAVALAWSSEREAQPGTGGRSMEFSTSQPAIRGVFPAEPAGLSCRQLQDQRRAIGEPGDPFLMGIVDRAGASGQLL